MIAPVPTINGSIKAETHEYVYLLFSYIYGVTQERVPLSVFQQEELAEIVGELHHYGVNLPFDMSGITETFDIPCDKLLDLSHKPDGSLCLYRQRDMLMRSIDLAYSLAEAVKADNPPFVLCHTDIHGWNLMQGNRLVLLDWESIKYAPAEADLFAIWGNWYWGNLRWGSYWERFLPVYRRIRPEYTVREDFLRFYQIRRHIEDINEFYKQYLYDDMTAAKAREVESCLEREVAFLSAFN